MNRSTRSKLAVGVLAVVAACASAASNAAPAHVQVQVQVPGQVYGQPQAVYGAPQAVYGQPPVVYQQPAGAYGRPAIVPVQAACGAPRWDPRVRYMPGQVVRRHGELWVARGVSARVYNENSPPEWTPQYWTPAVCR